MAETAEPSVAAIQRTHGPARLTRLLPWLLPLVGAVGGLLAIDVPLGDIVRYAAYFGGCVILPGILLLRAAWRSTGNWGEDVGLGAAVGMAYQLLGWAIFTAVGLQAWLLAWPLLLIAVFAAVPQLRPYWRITRPEPLPVAWSWGMAICATLLVVYVSLAVMADHKPPPDGTSYYQDLLYHLSMVHELIRSVPPELPQVAGERLEYHWFANADMAGAADVTGLSPVMVMFRLWLLPQAVVSLLVCAALARQVSKVWWTGVLAAVAVLPAGLASLLSPSHTFSIATSTAAAIFLVDALFHRSGRRGVWILGAALAVVAGGSKPSTLPILLGGVGLAALFLLLRDRKLPWRLVAAGLVLLLALAGTLRFVAGSTSGSGMQLLAILKFDAFYRAITGDLSVPGTGGFLPVPLTSGDSTVVTGVGVMLGLTLLSYAGLLIGFGLLVVRSTRRQPAAWMLAGSLTAAWLGLLLLNHPAASQQYFLRGVVPFATAATCWLVAVAFEGRGRRTILPVGVAAAALGVVFQQLIRRPALDPARSRAEQVETLARPLVTVAVLIVLVIAGWFLTRRIWARRPGAGLAVPVLIVIMASLAGMARYSYYAFRTDGTYRAAGGVVRPDEQAAARWLTENTAPTDVVVTGSWCRPGPRRPGCDARGWLVSGLAGRRTLVEGWAYTQQALATNGTDGKLYAVQPSPWPDRVELSTQILTAPTPQLLENARQYGARWIYADSSDGPVSPSLDQLARLRYQEGKVRIYELPAQ
ncbi:hypothetical protein Kfla_0491 [Kribbella flavida DSM 17836]|uniref:Uncharacterized protein n=1 Tax=Kribbella flavida (strain DSM 17836 / JCM 10339 / NBRC 14399) TaxID=479435 RepID=D2PVV6_KRIFD|nr:hypothetical protein Kfla_0491 [Kribbella flavida DSM 17836]